MDAVSSLGVLALVSLDERNVEALFFSTLERVHTVDLETVVGYTSVGTQIHTRTARAARSVDLHGYILVPVVATRWSTESLGGPVVLVLKGHDTHVATANGSVDLGVVQGVVGPLDVVSSLGTLGGDDLVVHRTAISARERSSTGVVIAGRSTNREGEHHTA